MQGRVYASLFLLAASTSFGCSVDAWLFVAMRGDLCFVAISVSRALLFMLCFVAMRCNSSFLFVAIRCYIYQRIAAWQFARVAIFEKC